MSNILKFLSKEKEKYKKFKSRKKQHEEYFKNFDLSKFNEEDVKKTFGEELKEARKKAKKIGFNDSFVKEIDNPDYFLGEGLIEEYIEEQKGIVNNIINLKPREIFLIIIFFLGVACPGCFGIKYYLDNVGNNKAKESQSDSVKYSEEQIQQKFEATIDKLYNEIGVNVNTIEELQKRIASVFGFSLRSQLVDTYSYYSLNFGGCSTEWVVFTLNSGKESYVYKKKVSRKFYENNLESRTKREKFLNEYISNIIREYENMKIDKNSYILDLTVKIDKILKSNVLFGTYETNVSYKRGKFTIKVGDYYGYVDYSFYF